MNNKFAKIIFTVLTVSSLLISGASAASLMTEEHIEKLQAYDYIISKTLPAMGNKIPGEFSIESPREFALYLYLFTRLDSTPC